MTTYKTAAEVNASIAALRKLPEGEREARIDAFIANLNNSPELTDEQKAQYMAQAKKAHDTAKKGHITRKAKEAEMTPEQKEEAAAKRSAAAKQSHETRKTAADKKAAMADKAKAAKAKAQKDATKAAANAESSKKKYGLFRVTNSATSGRQLRAYTIAGLISCGTLTVKMNTTKNGGDAMQFRDTITPAKKAMQWHGAKGNIIEKEGRLFISPEWHAELSANYAEFGNLVDEYLTYIQTGKVGEHMTGQKGAPIAKGSV